MSTVLADPPFEPLPPTLTEAAAEVPIDAPAAIPPLPPLPPIDWATIPEDWSRRVDKVTCEPVFTVTPPAIPPVPPSLAILTLADTPVAALPEKLDPALPPPPPID